MSKNSHSDLGQAWRSHAVGRDDTAVRDFEKLARENPEDIDVLYGQGLAQRGAGHKAQAVETFQRVISLCDSLTADHPEEAYRLEMLARMARQQIQIMEGA